MDQLLESPLCDVVNIQNTPDGQKVVQTTCGDITADRVVLATGADSSSVARLGGFELPQRSTPGVIVITDPLPPLLNGILVAPGVHIHQRIDGRLVIGEQEGAPDTEAHRARLMGRPTAFPTADISAEHARSLLTLARQYLQMPDKVVVNEAVITVAKLKGQWTQMSLLAGQTFGGCKSINQYICFAYGHTLIAGSPCKCK